MGSRSPIPGNGQQQPRNPSRIGEIRHDDTRTGISQLCSGVPPRRDTEARRTERPGAGDVMRRVAHDDDCRGWEVGAVVLLGARHG
jgi:hypothetical protein